MAVKKKQENMEGSSRKLRSEAEKKVARSSDKSAELKKQDLDKLVHELQVHQVELEMQNEELRTAQMQLEKSREDYVDLYDFAPVGYFTFSSQALIIEVNLTGAALLGVERTKLLKRRFRQFVAPADAERWDRHFVNVLQQGEKQSCDLLLKHKDGSTLYARLDSIRVEMDDGTGVVRTAISDITAEKQADQSREENEKNYRLLADNTTDIVLIMDMDLNITWISASVHKMSGFSVEEEKSMPLDKRLAPESVKKSIDSFTRILQAEKEGRIVADGYLDIELEIYHKDGSTFWTENRLKFIRDNQGKAIGILMQGRDISARKILENNLENERREFKLIVDSSPIIIFYKDPSGRIIRANKTFTEALKMTEDEILGKTVFDLYSATMAKAMTNDDQAVLKSGRPRLNIVEQYESASGTRWVQTDKIPILDENGVAVGLLGFAQDITERTLVEKNLQLSEDRYRTLVDKAIEGIIVIQDGKIIFANPRAYEIIGYPRDRKEPRPFIDFLHVEDREKVIDGYLRRLKSEQLAGTYPFRLVDQNGNTKWVQGSAVRIDWEGKPATLTFLADITENKKAEEALRKSEAQYLLLSEHMTDTIRLMDMSLKTTYLSPSAEKLRGFTYQEVLELPLEKQITPESLRLATGILSEELPRVEADPGYNPIHTIDLEYYCKDGTTLWEESKFSVIRDKNGKPVSILAEARDITERRKTDGLLRASEAQYRLLAEHTTDTVWLMDMNLQTTYQSPSVQRVRGFTPQEIKEIPLEKHLTPEALKIATDVFLAEMAKMEADPDYNFTRTLELEFYRKDGTTFWSDNTFSLIRDENGKPLSILGEGRDITERKLVEEALLREKRFSDALIDSLPGTFYVIDDQVKYVRWNKNQETITGYSADEMQCLNPLDTIVPEDRDRVATRTLEVIISGAANMETTLVTKNGRKIPFYLSLTPIVVGDKTYIVGVGIDITERKQAEDALRQSEVKYRTVLEQIEEAYYEVDLVGNLTFFNDATCRQLGYSIEELMGMNYRVYTSKDDMQRVYETFNQVYRTGKPITEFSVCRIRKDGVQLFTENSALPLRNKDGKIIGFRGVARDITERLQAEAALRESAAQYRLLSEHTTDFIWLMDMDLNPTYQSPSAERYTGFTHDELMGLSFEKRIAPESLRCAAEMFFEEIPRMMADPDYNPVRKLELEIYRKDGTTLWSENTFSLIRDENGKPVSILGEARDITERREAEKKLERSLAALEKTMGDTVVAISKMVEMKDPFTAGHQIRVAQLASALAKKLNLTEEQVTYLNTAATIHDIGKIYVPSDILSKPGKLGVIEFQIIQTHVQGSYDILKKIDFSGPIAQIVYQHHERLDGSGYPRGMKGIDILPEAKILIVADVVEAMSSHRPYRASLGIEKALEEITLNRGSKYDEAAVDACLELFRNGHFEFKPA